MDKKVLTKKILITIALAMLVALGLYVIAISIISCIGSVDFLTNKIYEFYEEVDVWFNVAFNQNLLSLIRTFLIFVFCCFSTIIETFLIVKLWRSESK